MEPKAFDLAGILKSSGQDVRLHSEGGGTLTIEFDEQQVEGYVALRKAGRGRNLRILIEVLEPTK